MTDRAALSRLFVQSAGWGEAQRAALPIDASARSYDRLTLGARTAILMNAPPGQGDDPADFIRIARYLAENGLSAPQILAEDLGAGFLLLEDFGDAVFARLFTDDPDREGGLCALATDALIHLARAPLPLGVPNLTAADWAEAACLAISHYAAPSLGSPDPAPLAAALTQALRNHADGPRLFIHRDFHAENLILLPSRIGLRQVGLLDFQLGQAGQAGYDLVSLMQDARRDVAPQTETQMIARYAKALALDPTCFAASYAVLGAQRALRILGIFARQSHVLGKARYLPMIPRVWGHLHRNLAHPALADLRQVCLILPPPTPETLQSLAPK